MKQDLDFRSVPSDSQLWRSWLVISDALQVQRLHLHMADCRQAVGTSGPVSGVSGVPDARVLLSTPSYERKPLRPVDLAGLSPFTRLPFEFALAGVGANPLESAALRALHHVLDGCDTPILDAGHQVAAAAAWWVGYFAIYRPFGIHHLSFQPIDGPIALSVLEQAAAVVALGWLHRVLEAEIRGSEKVDSLLELAFCRATAAAVVAEKHMPALLDALSELCLVDFVTLAVPWRGRFVKYSGGTGAGQAE